MDFGLTDEQRSIVEVTRAFVERELYPHEEEVERTGVLRPELTEQIRAKALSAGLVAANMPEEVGGAGLDTVTWVLYEKELGKAGFALQYAGVPRPSNILLAGTAEQRERYLLPCVRGERVDCLAMTEPDAGSDMRAMRTRATRVADGDGWRISGTKHFISHADEADFVILVAVTGVDDAGRAAAVDVPRRPRHPRVVGARGLPQRLPPRLHQLDPRLRRRAGSATTRCSARRARASSWPAPGSARPGSRSPPRASAAPSVRSTSRSGTRPPATSSGSRSAASRAIGFKLADMATELRAAELMTLHTAWKHDRGTATDADIAMAKLKATEVLAMVADEAIQVHGGMGLMDELPLERIWRDARIERIWDGTSEIQRHIISRSLLRPLGA